MMVSLLTLSIIMCNGSTGVNFIKQNSFYSTYSMWALSLSIDLDPYYTELASINRTFYDQKENVINQIERKTQQFVGEPTRNDVALGAQRIPSPTVSNVSLANRQIRVKLVALRTTAEITLDAFESQLNYISIKLFRALNDIKEVYTQPSNTRTKRSLLPWGGDLLNALFGTATDSDLEGLRTQLGRLATNQNQLVHVVENSLSMINKTNAVAQENRHLANNLVDDVNNLNTKITQLRATALTNVRITRLSETITTQITTVLRSLSMSLQGLESDINKLASHLDQGMRGELSTSLVPPTQLRKILADIEELLPGSLEIKDYEDEQVMWYYKHLPVTVIPDNNKLHIVTVIPLIPTDSLFNLYRVVVLPLPIADSNKNSKIIIEGTHFAVSYKGTAYVILDEDELALCSDTDTTYCPLHRAAMSIERMPSCLSSLFEENAVGVKNNCPVRVTDTEKYPIFRHLSRGQWMVTTRQPLTIHPRCDPQIDLVKPIKVAPPVQIITLDSGCTGFTEFGDLPPYFYQSSHEDASSGLGRLNVGENMQPIYDLSNSNYTYDFQLINPTPLSAEKLKADGVIDISKEQVKLDKLKRNIVRVWSTRDGVYTALGAIGGFLVIAVVIALVVIIYKLYKNKNVTQIVKRYNKANNSEDKAKNSEVDQGRVVACNMGDNELLEKSTKLLGCPSLHQLQQPESYIDLSL